MKKLKLTIECGIQSDKELRDTMEQPSFSFTYFTGAGGPVTLHGKDKDGFYSFGYPIDLLTGDNVLFRFSTYDKMIESLCRKFEFTPALYERIVDAFNKEQEGDMER